MWQLDRTLNRERLDLVSSRVDTIHAEVEALKKHRTECDLLHEQHKEHKRRSDDAMNNLTESNMMLAKSITDINVTITKVVGIIERDQPDITALKNARIAWTVNKWVFLTVVSVAAGCATIYSFYQGLL